VVATAVVAAFFAGGPTIKGSRTNIRTDVIMKAMETNEMIRALKLLSGSSRRRRWRRACPANRERTLPST